MRYGLSDVPGYKFLRDTDEQRSGYKVCFMRYGLSDVPGYSFLRDTDEQRSGYKVRFMRYGVSDVPGYKFFARYGLVTFRDIDCVLRHTE